MTLPDLMVKMAERSINVLDTKPIYGWDDSRSSVIGYMVDFEYQYSGYLDPDCPEVMTTGWRKMSYEYFGPDLAPLSVGDAYEEVYKIATKVQDTIATPFQER